MFDSIISARQLQDLASTAQPIAIFDTRFKLDDTQYGAAAYAKDHIPGAIYLHLDQDLSSPISQTTGRHPLPEIERFQATMRRHGVSHDTQVIVYDDAGGMFAARLWWLLKWLGHDSVAVLDGGWPAWIKAGGATSQSQPEPTTGNFTAAPKEDWVLSAEDVAAGLTNASITLCDARAPERYRGDVEPIDPVAGHIPGAVNVPFMQNLDENKCFKDPATLRAIHADTASSKTVHMCGSGVTACHNLLAYAVAGLPIPRLYAGSWSEWIRDPTRNVSTSQP